MPSKAPPPLLHQSEVTAYMTEPHGKSHLTGVKLLHQEIKALLASPLPGVQVIPNESDLFALTVDITGPSDSPFEDGIFTIKLSFCAEYPHEPPKGSFITTIFHPNVSPTTGEICVSTLKKDWRPTLGLAHLLLTIKSLLMTPNPESALNEAAGKLFLEDFDAFWQRAKLMTQVHAPKRPEKSNPAQKRERDTDDSGLSPESTNNPTTSTTALSQMRKKLKRL